ncbi:MAG: right-handed parallel beta-helix repeat-containing protein, partial [bacterium]|nr:right-handed parallel beta-helix repeat-containing protein [bacterium]
MSMQVCIRLALAVVLTLPFAYADGGAATLRVPEEYETIEAALAAAYRTYTVDIAAGTYYEHDLVWPPEVSILGRTGNPEDVIIDAQEQGRVLWGEDLVHENVLAYVTLCRGDAQGAGCGLRVEGDPIIHDVIIEHCVSGNGVYGIGMYSVGGITIVDCIFRYNQSDGEITKGGGAWLDSYSPHQPIWVNNVEVYGNRANYGSGLYMNTYGGTLENL